MFVTEGERGALVRVAAATLDGRTWSAWDLSVGRDSVSFRSVRAESVLLAGLFRKGLVDRRRGDWGGFSYTLSVAFRELLAAEFSARCNAARGDARPIPVVERAVDAFEECESQGAGES